MVYLQINNGDFFPVNCGLHLDTEIPELQSGYLCSSTHQSHFFVSHFMMHVFIP